MKVLVADDSRVSSTMLMRELTALGYEVTATHDGLETLELLRSPDGPDLVLLDWMMPGMEGIDVCRAVRSEPLGRYVYIVLVTMRERPEDIAAGFDAGADDFMVKPFDPSELGARVRVAERVLRYGERLRKANEDLMRLAAIDELTSLYTRTAMLDRLSIEASRHTRDGQPLSLLVADVDGLGAINERFGHAAGDALLRLVASAAQGACRIYDTVGRLDGDRFLVLLPSADPGNALTVAERLRGRVSAVRLSLDGEQFGATVSIGTATWDPTQRHQSAQRTIGAAEAALLRARGRGPNGVEVATVDDYGVDTTPAGGGGVAPGP